MNKNNSANTTCPDLSKYPPQKTSLEHKIFKNLQKSAKACQEYEKCSKANCGFPDIELKKELVNETMKNPSKIMNIVQKCLDSNDKISCTLDEYAKMSPKLKTIADKVKKCRKETCKKESDLAVLASNEILKQLPVKKIFSNTIKKIKNIKSNKVGKNKRSHHSKRQIINKK